MTTESLPPKIKAAAKAAREQASAYDSIFAPLTLTLKDGSTVEIPPHPNLQLLDDERLEAYEELLFEIESYDREPDLYIPEQTLSNGMVLPAETRRGAVIHPHRKDGKLIKPPYLVRQVRAVLGDELYDRIKAAGNSAKDVKQLWDEQALKLNGRVESDPKSNGSTSHLAAVPPPDSE